MDVMAKEGLGKMRAGSYSALKVLGGDVLLRTVGCRLLLSSGPSLDPPCLDTISKACLTIKHWGPTAKKPEKTLCPCSYRTPVLEPSSEELGVT